MSTLVQDAATLEITGNQPWPENVCLFQPHEVGQILPSDLVACLSVKIFLKFCDLDYAVEQRKNAESISPSGKLPVLKLNQLLVSEFDAIVAVVKAKGHNLSASLSDSELAELKAYSSMLDNLLLNAVHYFSWCDEDVAPVIKRRYGSPYTWPLNVILPWMKQRHITRQLSAIDWTNQSLQEVCQKVRMCCQALSQKLADKAYFFGDSPTELDALVFGHLYTLIATELPFMDLTQIIHDYPTLVKFCDRISEIYFQDGFPMSSDKVFCAGPATQRISPREEDLPTQTVCSA